jgi:hypothetical protein
MSHLQMAVLQISRLQGRESLILLVLTIGSERSPGKALNSRKSIHICYVITRESRIKVVLSI